jgi:hypothetical protein
MCHVMYMYAYIDTNRCLSRGGVLSIFVSYTRLYAVCYVSLISYYLILDYLILLT